MLGTVDAQRLLRITWMMNVLILCPFTIIFGLSYLYILMGWTLFPGLLIFFIFMVINLLVVKKGLIFLKKFMKVRSERIKQTNEAFNNIKLIKSLSLERFYLTKITDIRKKELGWLRLLFYRMIYSMMNSTLGPGVFLLTLFGVHSAAGYELTSGKIFTTISIFNTFIWALNYLPDIFSNFIDLLISSERLTNYLFSDDIERMPNLFNDEQKVKFKSDDPKLRNLYVEDYREQILNLKRDLKEQRGTFKDEDDGEEIPLAIDDNYQKPEKCLFDTTYDFNKKEEPILKEQNEEMENIFAGNLFDLQINNLDFFWSRFWVKDEEEEEKKKKEKEKKEKEKKENIKMKDNEKTDSKSIDESKFSLRNINLEIKKGEFVCIIGKSGSGKSSLLMSVLGELFARPSGFIPENETEIIIDDSEVDNSESNLNFNPKISYLSQKPWIRNATVKANILFGKPFVLKRYKECIDYSGLEEDLKILKDGEQTIIGDKGINLSGGQKVRVGLARSLYSGSDLFLLDDPLSALDVNVGSHIFRKALKGYLRGKTRLVVTHSLGYLKHFDRILFFDEGKIIFDGTYQDILSKPFYLGKLTFILLISARK